MSKKLRAREPEGQSYGISRDQILYSLKLTPAQRLKRLDAARNFYYAVTKKKTRKIHEDLRRKDS
ncbi:MAG: hypothetical protein HZC17_04580 [Candidatus Omnitrophica bacterium]|nr:hypothetical protein [Candidatus Omnitrophota bacterium]